MTIDLGYLDTNIFVHVLHPNDDHHDRCKAITDALQDGTATGWIDATAVYELTFILARRRRFPDRRAIAEYVIGIISAPGVQTDDRQALLTALQYWVSQNSGFADAWLLARALTDGRPVCSVDRRDFPGIANTFYEQ
jgi:predicted nucleic acid-binding protein